jgi:hypothetical protein
MPHDELREPLIEPFPEGALCLAGRAAGKKAGNADVFV